MRQPVITEQRLRVQEHLLRVHIEAVRMVLAGEADLTRTWEELDSALNGFSKEMIGYKLARCWVEVLTTGDFQRVLEASPEGARLRAASPMMTVVPRGVRHKLRRMPRID